MGVVNKISNEEKKTIKKYKNNFCAWRLEIALVMIMRINVLKVGMVCTYDTTPSFLQ